MELAGFLVSHGLAILLLALTAYVLGRLILTRFAFGSTLEAIACGTTLGLGALSLILFFVGILGGFHVPALIVLLLGIWLAAFPVWKRWFAWRRSVRQVILAALAVMIVLVLTAPMWLLAFYPPADWDDISYHLAAAKQYAEQGRLTVTPYLRFAVFPQAVNMLFTASYILADDIIVQLVSTLMWLLTGLLLFVWGRRDDSTATGVIAACLWLAGPTVIRFATTAYIDVGLTLFVVAAAYGLFRWIEERETGWLLLAGFCTGMAAGCKYSGLFFLPFYALVIAAASRPRERYSSLLAFVGVAVAAALPWYVRNTIVTGDPVFPTLSAVISNPYWSATDIALQRAELASHGIGRDLIDLVTVWWDIGWNQGLFHSESLVSLALIIPIPLLLVLRRRSFRARVLLTLCLAYVLVWFHTGQVMRYLLPILPFLALEMAALATALVRWIVPVSRKNLRALATTAIAVAIVGQGVLYGAEEIRTLGALPVNQQSRDEHLSRLLPDYPVYQFLRERHGDDYVLYALRGGRMNYYADGVIMGDVFGPARTSRIDARLGSGQGLYDELRVLGADHFLVSYRAGDIDLPDDEAFRRYFQLVFQDGDIRLYELTAKSE